MKVYIESAFQLFNPIKYSNKTKLVWIRILTTRCGKTPQIRQILESVIVSCIDITRNAVKRFLSSAARLKQQRDKVTSSWNWKSRKEKRKWWKRISKWKMKAQITINKMFEQLKFKIVIQAQLDNYVAVIWRVKLFLTNLLTRLLAIFSIISPSFMHLFASFPLSFIFPEQFHFLKSLVILVQYPVHFLLLWFGLPWILEF